jgi:drug/metabolite transporter (DMT)-like permease
VLLFATVVIWGWTFVATKIALEHVAPLDLLGLRMAVGLPVLLAVVLARRTRFDFDRRDLAQAALGGAVFAAHFVVQVIGISGTTATNSGWIIAVSPIVIALLSAAFLRERIGREIAVGLSLATVGVLLLVSHGDPGRLAWLKSTGDWLVLASAFTWALYTVATRDLSRRRAPLAVTAVVLVPLTLVGVAAIAIHGNGHALLALPGRTVAAILFLGVFGTALGQWFWQLGVARIGAAKAGLFLYVEPLATTALAVPLLGEPFGPLTVAGALLVLAGVWWAERRRRA